MSRMYRTNNDPVYRAGDIIRYEFGETALMRVETISKGHGGDLARYYGTHCMGGVHGAYHTACENASPEDLKTWAACEKWRKP